jgi:hypothetical protein
MPHVVHLNELGPVERRAIVVNVATELATTLALASLRCHAPETRVLLVNCDAQSESRVHFEYLSREWDFDIVDLPLRAHGQTLDHLVAHLPAGDQLWMLFDSDAELQTPDWVANGLDAFSDSSIYGWGHLQAGNWIGADYRAAPETCWWPTKFWTCAVLLRAKTLRGAARAGVRLEPQTVYNDVARAPGLSRVLSKRFDSDMTSPAKVMHQLPRTLRDALGRARLPWLAAARREYEGVRPNYLYCDTGSLLHRWATQRGLRFVGSEPPPPENPIVRWWLPGLTSRLLHNGPAEPSLVLAEVEIRDHLLHRHGLDWDDFGTPAWSWPVGYPQHHTAGSSSLTDVASSS